MSDNRNTSVLILAILVILLIIGLGVLIVRNIHQKKSMTGLIEQMQFEKEQLEKDFSDLEMQFEEFQDVKIENDSLADLITKERQHVQDLLEELRTTKATNAKKIAELKKELASVRGLLQEYVRQIDQLTAANAALTEENAAVKKKIKDVSDYADELGKRNDELTSIVDRAARLEVDNLSIIKLNKKGRKTSLPSQVAKLEFDYTIKKNVTTEPGMKVVYVQVTDSEGNVFLTENSGTFVYEGEDLQYTLMKEFEYEGTEMQDVIFWTLDSRLSPDVYSVEFFIDGALVGSFEFEIKK